jgi:pyruvate dehydrogenase (quinone)
MKVVIYSNSAFGLITLEAESVGLPPVKKGIEFPNPDFAALACACGGHGITARKPGELRAATARGSPLTGRRFWTSSWLRTKYLAKIKAAVQAVTGT